MKFGLVGILPLDFGNDLLDYGHVFTLLNIIEWILFRFDMGRKPFLLPSPSAEIIKASLIYYLAGRLCLNSPRIFGRRFVQPFALYLGILRNFLSSPFWMFFLAPLGSIEVNKKSPIRR